MLKYVREQLAKQGVFSESNVPIKDELDDSMFIEAAHVLDELSEISSDGVADHDSVRDIRGISIPVQEDFDIELDTVEFCMADGRMQDIPGDASALQEAYYNDLKSFTDFYAEAYSSTTRLPRESYESFEDRVLENQYRMYNEYMETVVQEGLFGFGEIKLSSPEIVWNVHINFGKLRDNGGEEFNATLPVAYEATKRNKVLKKQVDCVKTFDYCKIRNAREALLSYAKENGVKVPKDGNIWDVIIPNGAFVPQEQNDKYTMYIRYKVTTTGEEIFFTVTMSMRSNKNATAKSVDSDIIDSKDIQLEMKRKDISTKNYVNKQTFTESYVEMNMPSRWDNNYFQEAIDFGGGGDPPEMATNAPAPTSPTPPAPNTPPMPNDAGNGDAPQGNETNINIDLPPEEGQGNDTAAPTQDNNQPADPPMPENPNTNDVSDQIAAGVNEELEKQNVNAVDLSANPDEDPNFDMSTEPSDIGAGDMSMKDDANADVDSAELDTENIGGDMSADNVDFDNMTLNQLIEQAQEKTKDMTIEQLKSFLMDNTTPDGEAVGNGAEDGVQESFIYTKSNINNSMDVLLRTALGILNDDKLELSVLIKKFKKNGKKLNKCLTKASKMDSVYDVQERKQISLLNRCLVDLMSMVRENSSASNTQTAKRLVKAFVSQAEAVGKIIDNHKDTKEKVTQEGAITALFNVREKLERRANFVHINVTLPIKNKVEADKLTVAFIKSYFKSDIRKHTSGSGNEYDTGYGATIGSGSSTITERETDNPRLTRLDALTDLGRRIESKDRKRAKFTETELKNLDRTATLAIELRDDIKSILKVENSEEAHKLLNAIGNEACELDTLCKTFKKQRSE